MIRRWVLFLALAGGTASCGPLMTEGDYYHVERKGAVMPVWVRGNLSSGVWLVTLHGGPGHSGHDFTLSKSFQALEEKYAIIYWDQRYSGLAKGNPSPDTFTLANFVADTDAVIGAMQQTYGFDEFFLIGHSWGGALGHAFLLDGSRRDDVAGWIDYDGDHDMQLSADLSREWMMNKAQELVDDDIDAQHWAEALQWYEDHPIIKPSDPVHYSYLSSTNAYFYDFTRYEPPAYGELAFRSPYSMGFYQTTDRSLILGKALADGLDLSDRLQEITVPTLFLWGAEDGVIPPAVAHEAYALIGTPTADKSLIEIPEVAHSPHDEDPVRFETELTRFIQRYAE